jgi:trans-aconitate methyltransferase
VSTEAMAACEAEAFENRYRHQEDPWDFRTSQYERNRYAITLAALPRQHYAFAFEPGCSIGELTALLAVRCERVLATDVSATAVERARQRCSQFPHVQIECGDIRTATPDASPDLIVLSEIAYYFTVDELRSIACHLGTVLQPGGCLIAVHWLGESPDHILHGDEVHEVLLRALPLRHQASVRHQSSLSQSASGRRPSFRLDRWTRV